MTVDEPLTISMARYQLKTGIKIMFKRNFAFLFCLAVMAGLSGCMTIGYSTAKDPNLVKKWDVTIIEIEPQNIYNATGVFWVGPFASVEHKGQKITFMDSTGVKVTIVQPTSNRYELHPTEKAVYIVDRGQVWVQPSDYPLPPEFNAASPSPQASKPEIKVLDVPSPPKSTSTQTTNAQRLKELNELFKEGLIDKSDYETKKKAILDAM